MAIRSRLLFWLSEVAVRRWINRVTRKVRPARDRLVWLNVRLSEPQGLRLKPRPSLGVPSSSSCRMSGEQIIHSRATLPGRFPTNFRGHAVH